MIAQMPSLRDEFVQATVSAKPVEQALVIVFAAYFAVGVTSNALVEKTVRRSHTNEFAPRAPFCVRQRIMTGAFRSERTLKGRQAFVDVSVVLHPRQFSARVGVSEGATSNCFPLHGLVTDMFCVGRN